MKQKLIYSIVLLLSLPLNLNAQQAIESLRGFAIDTPSPPAQMQAWERDRDPIPRDYVSQPPLVPHKIEGYEINRKFNKCLSCHSWSNYKKSGATKISQTHFQDRERSVRANVAGTRYFCTQCHVAQTDTTPLVENTFQPVEAIQQ